MASAGSFGGYEEDRFENKVDIKLKCSVCLKVLKDPVQCPNEHYFCRSCIQTNLRHNAKTCPVCQHPLTEETLTKPPRILTELLESLMIRCDNKNRGCQELIKLECLDHHVRSCGYSPTRCRNACCAEVMNRHKKEQHKRELCEFRKVVCDECGERLTWKSSRLHPCIMRSQMDDMARRGRGNEMALVEGLLGIFVGRQRNERSEWFNGQQKIFVCGGYDGETFLNSVESYSWPDNSWTLEPAMNEKRAASSAFVHDREIYVSGGWTGTKFTDSIESLNVHEKNINWKSQFKMPIECNKHKMVCHENNVIQSGGRGEGDNVSDGIYQISLNPPHSTKLLTKMPEPRCSHGCQVIDNQVVVAGGQTSKHAKDAKNTVYACDLKNNELKTLTPLPFPITDMATVSYKGNIILIGGINEKGQTLDTVIMYDVKTGKIKMLPCLNYKRAHCAAVIVGNVIVVIGGYVYETETCLNSVECLDLSMNVRRELSPMTTKRSFATAVVKSVC